MERLCKYPTKSPTVDTVRKAVVNYFVVALQEQLVVVLALVYQDQIKTLALSGLASVPIRQALPVVRQVDQEIDLFVSLIDHTGPLTRQYLELINLSSELNYP